MIKEFLRKTGLYIPDKMELHEVMRRLLKDNLSFGLPMAVLTAASGLIYFFVSADMAGVDSILYILFLLLVLRDVTLALLLQIRPGLYAFIYADSHLVLRHF